MLVASACAGQTTGSPARDRMQRRRRRAAAEAGPLQDEGVAAAATAAAAAAAAAAVVTVEIVARIARGVQVRDYIGVSSAVEAGTMRSPPSERPPILPARPPPCPSPPRLSL